MALQRALVATPWTGNGTPGNAFRPLVADVFAVDWSDWTGQGAANLVPSPNLFLVEVTADETVVQAIDADSRFEVLATEDVVDAAG